jgi:tRNA(Ile)-lysidine synthase
MTGPLPTSPEAFRAEVVRLAGAALAEGPVAAAVSGGPDSLALLWLAARAFGGRVRVLTVDHGLRPGSADDAAEVMRRARGLGLEAALLPARGAPVGQGLQAWAREARYAAMAGWCRAHAVPLLMTAHHADDQAETLLMRLARGSGLAGLAGIRPVRALEGGPLLVRPLLGARRRDLAAVVAAAGWTALDDPANRDPRHARTAMRALLAQAPMLDSRRLAASAAALQESEAALEWATRRAWESRAEPCDGEIRLDPEGLPGEIRRRLLARALAELGACPRGGEVARLAGRLTEGGAGTLGGVAVRATADGWRLRRAAPRRSAVAG